MALYSSLFGAYLDAPTVMSLDKLQLCAYLEVWGVVRGNLALQITFCPLIYLEIAAICCIWAELAIERQPSSHACPSLTRANDASRPSSCAKTPSSFLKSNSLEAAPTLARQGVVMRYDLVLAKRPCRACYIVTAWRQ
ncbi:hypothetical protein Acr_22g0009770 [Actinidia rufa]|uniref:Uncharacterized protein n=1 Tax=Actinidia rufa TaxID=165716 RepID=A0A7J0GL78_9ERIC|nr:hypothetical protein Acr_22g0009770 [Actinidia rufa]